MPYTWQPRFTPSRPDPPDQDKLQWSIRFPLMAGSASYFFAALVHAIACISYSSAWRIPLTIACLSCGLLLGRLSSPAHFQDPPRFKRLWRYYSVIAVPYSLIQSFRLLLLFASQTYEIGAWWLTGLVVAMLAMFGALIYSTGRRRRTADARSDIEQLAQDDGSWYWVWWTAVMTEFPVL